MKNSYEVLGINEGSTEAEIKKAYFALVRCYSPEHDPEKFQEIREAYERLKNKEEDTDQDFAVPEDAFAVKLLEKIKKCLVRRDYWQATELAEGATQFFPKELVFRYLLAISQRQEGSTGKAVKNCELLVKAEPDNRRYRRELALAYMDRGYKNKAISAFKKAYEMGCHDPEFVLRYSEDCEDNKRIEEARTVLLEMLEEKKRWKRQEISCVLEAYGRAAIVDGKTLMSHGERIARGFLGFMREYTAYLDENAEIVTVTYLEIFKNCLAGLPQGSELEKEILQEIDQSLYTEEGREKRVETQENFKITSCYEDRRLSEILKQGIEIFLLPEELSDDPVLIHYAQLDIKLCLLEELPDILKQFDILEREYPDYYEKIRDFIEKLRSGNDLKHLKKEMQKEYGGMEEGISGGKYYGLYPEEKKNIEKERWNLQQPYVREGKKIGRNDPCPCGSGKKYKQCCGKNL